MLKLLGNPNINIYNSDANVVKSEDEDDDDENFEGAIVADPIYNDKVGICLYGQPTNNIFNNAIDMDMSAFYPSSIFGMNIDGSTLIFKAIMTVDQFDIMGGSMKFNGITGSYFNRGDDAAKECIDNFQTGNYMSTATKWLNLPDVNTIYKLFKKRRSK
jgi:hypothetical protein